jgi:hypothetical protein
MKDHLTKPDPKIARLVRKTPPGMAHWASTGPAGATCGRCLFYQNKTERCGKYIAMMRAGGSRNVPVLKVPSSTEACRHYELAPPGELARREADRWR